MMNLDIFSSCLVVVVIAASRIAFAGSTNETDYQALLAFKSQIKQDPLGALNSWNGTIHFCSWRGVTCGKKHGRVVALKLPALQLAGTLSPHIGNLSFLRVLDLHNNGFGGILFRDIGPLTRLRTLRLANNSFQGELPTNITNYMNLSYLDLTGNNLQGRIPQEFGSLARLFTLSFARNHLGGEIPPSLGNLTDLRQLALAENHFEGSIPPQLGQLSNLVSLSMFINNLSGSIPSSLFNASSIELLSLACNNLTGSLPFDLFLKSSKLTGLLLSYNKLSGPIPPSITNASQLKTIDIGKNYFRGPVPINLGGLKNIEFLGFSDNILGTEGGGDLRFLTSLTNCTKLRVVSLYQNGLNGTLPNSIANFSTTLTYLQLTFNFISGVIPYGIGNLASLVFLSVYSNMLAGKIPESIGKLSQLQRFEGGVNSLSGSIPPSIGNMSALTDLLLEHNMLEGTIPASLGNCTNLSFVNLSQNRLAGSVPRGLFGLSSLSLGLSLASNSLTGPIPDQVGKLVNLAELDLSDNSMSGEIPPALGDCVLLNVLNLKGNRFIGEISPSLTNLRGLESLDVSRNNLSGQIPSFLEDLPFLENLNLSYNMLEGEVPTGGIFGNLSAISVAGNPALCGGNPALFLPQCKEGTQKNHRNSLGSRKARLITSVTVPVILLLLTGGIILMVLLRTKKSKGETNSASSTENHHPKLSYAELSQATDGFSPAKLIGEGSFGTVYKGVLLSNTEVIAVKVLKLEEHGALKSFMSECEALRNIRHRNLVKNITSCSAVNFKGENFKALVFEFMENGSLERWLHPVPNQGGVEDGNTTLSLRQRLNIIIDVASALDYLHHQCHEPLVHCDLKPSNVLLDRDFVAHLSDFGLSKFLLVKASGSEFSSTVVRGTVGYVAPEYGVGGEVSTRGDVYSFGILLLELFTGRRPTGTMFSGELSLHEFVERSLPHGLNQVLDPSLCLEEVEGNLNQCLISILRVGLLCSATNPAERILEKRLLN